jgi:hypothetical protein
MMNKKERLQKAKKDHYKWIRSLGVDIDISTGKINAEFVGNPFPNYKSDRVTPPTSDKICGIGAKKYYPTLILPEGKAISIAYNKGAYQIVDKEDLKHG